MNLDSNISKLPPKRFVITQAMFKRYAQNLAPLITKPKNRAYTTTILSFLVVSLFLWYAIRPTIQTILTLRKEIKESQGVNKQMENKIGAMVEAQAIYQQNKDRLHLISEALPLAPRAVPLLLELKTIASQTGAAISNIQVAETNIDNTEATRPGATQKGGDMRVSKATITVDGNYAAIKSFFESLMNLRRLVNVTNFALAPSSKSLRIASDSADPQLRLLLQVDALSYPGGPNDER